MSPPKRQRAGKGAPGTVEEHSVTGLIFIEVGRTLFLEGVVELVPLIGATEFVCNDDVPP